MNHLSDDDSGPVSELLPTLTGQVVSRRGLVERIVEQFDDEFSPEFVAAVTDDVERRRMVRDVADYVLSVQSVFLAPQELARLLQMVYSEVMGYGGLDPYFADPDVTTIAVEGAARLAVRYRPGSDLAQKPPVFDDTRHMRRIMGRLLNDAGASLESTLPITEAGLVVRDRPVRVTVALPPFVAELRADIRVHPEDVITLEQMERDGFFNAPGRQVVEAVARSGHGFVIVGDTESGKTTLLNAMALAAQGPIVSVERAGEMRLPAGSVQLVGSGQASREGAAARQETSLFEQRIEDALKHNPALLLLDEVRADEPQAIARLLQEGAVPRLAWAFRGASEAKRVRSGLGMLARMAANNAAAEDFVDRLYARLPFIIMVKRRRGTIQMLEVAEWQLQANWVDYVPLLEMDDSALRLTGRQPQRALDLPDGFWRA
jgi:pilus assembly protein CpaF